MPAQVTEIGSKAQPWKAHWPPASTVDCSAMAGVQAGELMAVDGGSRIGFAGQSDVTGANEEKKQK